MQNVTKPLAENAARRAAMQSSIDEELFDVIVEQVYIAYVADGVETGMKFTSMGIFDMASEALGFRGRVLTVCLYIALGAAGLEIVATELGYTPIPRYHANNNIAFFVICLLLLVLMKRRPDWFPQLAGVFVAAMFALFTAATIFVPADAMRFAWHFALTGISFLVLGVRLGWLVTVAVLISNICVVSIFGGLPPVALATLSIALVSVAGIFTAFSVQSERLLQRLAKANQSLFDLATRDQLTELSNRRAFVDKLDMLRRTNQEFSSVMVDLDHFKDINDKFGHDAGDLVLAGVASTLVRSVRSEDFVARIGGDEFAILLPATDSVDAAKVAEKVRIAVEGAETVFNGEVLKITASIGVATSGMLGTEGLPIRRSDVALYEAKRHGRNRVVVLKTEA